MRVVSWVGRHPLEWLLLALVGDVFMPAFHCNEIAISSQPHGALNRARILIEALDVGRVVVLGARLDG